jgi:hypothetical protein
MAATNQRNNDKIYLFINSFIHPWIMLLFIATKKFNRVLRISIFIRTKNTDTKN